MQIKKIEINIIRNCSRKKEVIRELTKGQSGTQIVYSTESDLNEEINIQLF